MSKKNIVLVAVLIVLGAIYVFNFTSLFQKPEMEITSRLRPQMNGRRGKGVVVGNTISFFLNRKYALTSIKVIEESDFKTNKYPHAIWHLISESNSVPTKVIVYGFPVEGMKPKIEKVRPEALQVNMGYVLMVEAGDVKGQTSFKIH
ncbi:MAG: hypothetical protein ABIP71_02400 [Verrucomicrobiota bacterium]